MAFSFRAAHWLLYIPVFLTACNTVPVRTAQDRKQVEVRDVPYAARDGEELRKKVVILPILDARPTPGADVSELARRVIVRHLNETGQFVIVDASDFPKELKTYVTDAKEYDTAAVAKAAANLGLLAVVEGKILDVKARRKGDDIGLFRKVTAQVDVTAQVRVIGARSGKEIYSVVKQASVEAASTRVAEKSYRDVHLEQDPKLVMQGVAEAFRSTIPDIVKAVEKLQWEGRVAMISGERIYVNAGRLSGLQVGDILKVVEEGDEVFDPETGAFIGYAPGRMKGTIEVVSYFGKDGAIGVIHSGSGFRQNDRVELY